jgi:Dyp-type peroxidase family
VAADPVTGKGRESVEVADVQGIVLQGYGRLRGAAYVVLEVVDAAEARAWLGDLASEVTTGSARPAGRALNIAFTAAGLAALGLPDAVVAGFSLEFGEGMTSAHRSRLLGDEGDAAPDRWSWGGPQGSPVHVLLLVFASDENDLAGPLAEHRRRAAEQGLREVAVLPTTDIGRGEHFGFRDGLSQPALSGVGRAAPPMHTLRAGEMLLGYRNEHGEYPRTPLVAAADDPDGVLPPDVAGSRRHDLGRNGSYLVLRSLTQEVGVFWRFLDEAARRPDGSSDPTARTALAARMVGRWPSGAPLTRSPHEDRPRLAADNDFGYAAHDPDGLSCPVGAHIRRTDPRDSLPPQPGTSASVAVGKRHRLLRRGRSFGPPLDVETALAGISDEPDARGLHFIALCADIARQFEFITHTWALNPHFAGLYDDADPLLGGHQEEGRAFTVQRDPVRRRFGDVPVFVTVRGGAYFFLPGLRALRYLAQR